LTSGAQTRECRFVEVDWGFPIVLVGSRVFLALRWTTLEKVLGVDDVGHWPYLAAVGIS
jgi:hypothetical protein